MNYNSFSQLKGLTWIEHYENIIAWERGNSQLLYPPIGVTIDLTTTCNLRCRGCNAARSWKMGLKLSKKEVFKIIDMLVDWRDNWWNGPESLMSVCFAGGGEPTLHPDFADIIKYTHENGFQVGISTNGTQLHKKKIREAIIKYTEFCGISFDCGFPNTWINYKRSNKRTFKKLFDGVNLLMADYKRSRRRPRRVDLAYKFLITEENQKEIFKACEAAKSWGFPTFFARPAAVEGLEIYKNKKPKFDVENIDFQMTLCKREETDKFKVYGSFSRVDPGTYGRTFKFKKCHSTPLLLQICADGYWYTCIDHRYQKEWKMKHWSEIYDFWGSMDHRRIVNNINLSKCTRCAGGVYNQQIEQCVEKDSLYRWFP